MAAAVEAHIKLVSGKVLQGRVSGSETIQGNKLLKVETDFGEILVQAKEVKEQVAPAVPPDSTFFARQVRVVRIQGTVERQTAPGGDWTPVKWTDAYGKDILNTANAIVRPGDRIRTGADGTLDLQLHRDAWVRVVPDSEIELPAAPTAPHSLALLKGGTVQQIDGKPRGAAFRVGTPSALLGVKGTKFAVTASEAGTTIGVAEGTVTAASGEVVEAGRLTSLGKGGESTSRDLTAAERETITVQTARLPIDDMVLIPGGVYDLGDGADAPFEPWGGQPPGSGRDPVGRLPNPPLGPLSPVASNLTRRVKVSMDPFLIDRREVALGEFIECRAAMGSKVPDYLVEGRVFPAGGFLPLAGVGWTDASRFARWAGKRLPTEAQWESAARGMERRMWPWGNRITPDHEHLSGCVLTYSSLPGTAVLGVQFTLSGALRPVARASVDVTPMGVQGLVSSVPEWTRDWVFYLARGKYTGPSVTGEPPRQESPGKLVIRGLLLATRYFVGMGAGERTNPEWGLGLTCMGMRCVVELE